jgi:tartrate dehydratase beta subunit/fumarate hydratase class I family protein
MDMEYSFNRICEELNNIKEKIQWKDIGSADAMIKLYMDRCNSLEAKLILEREDHSKLKSLHARRVLDMQGEINTLREQLHAVASE